MKIKLLLLSFLFYFPFCLQAQITVVRVQNNQVYLDTSVANNSVHKGDMFKVILSSEQLVNPKTGKELGLIYNYSPEGIITETQSLYAVGTLPSLTGIEIGQEAVIESASTPTQTIQSTAPQMNQTVSTHQKITYEPVEQEIISLSAGAISSPKADEIITLSNKGQITVWSRHGEKLNEVLSYQLTGTQKPLALSAVALRGKETAEIFVSVYDEKLARISTLILSYENNQWTTLDTLPYFIKEIGCGDEKTVWLQRSFIAGTRPGNARNLIYQNGKFSVGTEVLSTQRTWIEGLNLWPIEGQGKYLIFTTSNGRIKLELPQGKTTELKDFSVGAPNRVKYKQEIVKFYPSLQVVQTQGKTQVSVVENTTKFGLLSSTFGQYESGKIHFLSYEKGRLTKTDTVNLDGFVYDTACTQAAVLSAEILPDGKSSVVEILK